MPRFSQSKAMFSSAAMRIRWLRASIAILTVVTVLSSYFGIEAMNSIIQDSLCQDGDGLTRSGAPGVVIHLRPFHTVAQLFHTSALEAESWPPLAKDVSIAV